MAIVRVTLPRGLSFLATLSPQAIPYNDALKGVSHKKYLEIDNIFARELGIIEQGIQVKCELRSQQHLLSYSGHRKLFSGDGRLESNFVFFFDEML